MQEVRKAQALVGKQYRAQLTWWGLAAGEYLHSVVRDAA